MTAQRKTTLDPHQTLGCRKLAAAIENRGMSFSDFGRGWGFDKSTLSRILAGTRLPTLKQAVKLESLGIEPADWFRYVIPGGWR